jgi:hypothetical protein
MTVSVRYEIKAFPQRPATPETPDDDDFSSGVIIVGNNLESCVP